MELETVRCAVRKNLYGKALDRINRLLDVEPDCSDALLLKAQILWKGFGNAGAARAHPRKLMDGRADHNATVYRWACALHDEISEANGDTSP